MSNWPPLGPQRKRVRTTERHGVAAGSGSHTTLVIRVSAIRRAGAGIAQRAPVRAYHRGG
jgi:hypothetical protein